MPEMQVLVQRTMKKCEDLTTEWEAFQVWAKSHPLPSLVEVRKRRNALTADGNPRAVTVDGYRPVEYGVGPEAPDRAYISNHTGYTQPGSHNREHDDTGNLMNFSGVVYEFVNARIEPGYDYDEGAGGKV